MTGDKIGSWLLAAVVASTLQLSSEASAQAVHPRPTARDVAPQVNGVANEFCRVGYDTRRPALVPPDDSTSNNTPAASVAFDKPCVGAVFGHFTSEVRTSDPGDFIHVDMSAQCIRALGPRPCTPGEVVFAEPGHTFFRNTVGTFQTHAVMMVWPDLDSGRWRFFVRVGGNNSASVEFRAFKVEAYFGG
jgi:hypothetical protein